MKSIKILDCTLRDGGRIIDCKFPDHVITEVGQMLCKSKIDIIELGFIRHKVDYKGNTTFFTSIEQMIPFVDRSNKNTQYVAFVDFGMFDVDSISDRRSDSIDGIRFGFTKNNFMNDREEVGRQILALMKKGYDVYFQDVNTLGYSDVELLEIISFANQLNPVSFGIVDTYGAMDSEDLNRLFGIVNHNLNHEIAIDFHSHNNMQLSFSLSMEIIRLCRDTRNLIIDATLNGMGKCAGNLNTELIVSHMNRKLNCNYEMDLILDIIDEYLYEIKDNNYWGYSIPSFMAGIYKAHPNNVIYLTEKFRIRTKDIRRIIARIDEDTRQTYDYDNIQRIYVEYSANQVDDRETLMKLNDEMAGRDILVLVPGRSIYDMRNEISNFIKEKNPVIISVNLENELFKSDYAFYGNVRRYDKAISMKKCRNRIITSNIQPASNNDLVVSYFDLIESSGKYFDNTTIMLLNLLRKMDFGQLYMAGFDGFTASGKDYVDDSFYEARFHNEFESINKEMEKMLRNYAERTAGKIKITFLTPSIYKTIFG